MSRARGIRALALIHPLPSSPAAQELSGAAGGKSAHRTPLTTWTLHAPQKGVAWG